MKVGMVGMGRMGAGMAERLRLAGHEVLGYDSDASRSDAGSLGQLISALPSPRIVWLMLPAAATRAAVDYLTPLLSAGDILVDGGNSFFRDSQARAHDLAARQIRYLDVGTSGGVWGSQNGFCLMAGGTPEAFTIIEPLLLALAPAGGYAHLGASGAGHYAKMVHNAIEYGLMEAYAEGFQLLQASEFSFDSAAVASLWNQGSVVRSWLLELCQRALSAYPDLKELKGEVEDSGEGRWAVKEAVDKAVPLPAISAALYRRFASREEDSFALRLLAALRREFGGHGVTPA